MGYFLLRGGSSIIDHFPQIPLIFFDFNDTILMFGISFTLPFIKSLVYFVLEITNVTRIIN